MKIIEKKQIEVGLKRTIWFYLLMAFAFLFKIDARKFMPKNAPLLRMSMNVEGKIERWNLMVKDVL